MNKKYSKQLLAVAISLSLMTSTAQASFAGNGLKAAYNGVAVVGSAYSAYSFAEFAKNAFTSRNYAHLLAAGFVYTAISKAAISGAKGLVEAFTNNADDGMENEDGEE